ALALVLKSGLCGKFKEWVTEDGSAAYCQSWRDGSEYTQYFTMQEAEKAGLTSKKGPWQEYPRRQLQMRARSWHLRDTYPDVLCGLGIAEEAIDYARAQQEQKLQQQESQATSVVHTSNTKYQNDIAVVQWKDATTTTTAPTSFGQQPHQDEKPDTEIRSLIIDRIHDAVPVLCRAWGIKYSADGTTTPEFYERWHDLTGGVIMDEMTDEQLQTLYEIVIETKNEQEVKELLGDESKA
ncbi:MAG: hypothetical protein EBR82_81035, partial [Caulobacteraceae bacterium]|nr:hypothetical protein [Caulobacteraceae bacterium]